MMDCNEFRKWLADVESSGDDPDERAAGHMADCPRCERLFLLDSRLEGMLREGLKKSAAPEKLMGRLETNLKAAGTGGRSSLSVWRNLLRPTLKTAVPTMAAFAVLLLFFILKPGGGGLGSLEEVGALAVRSHMSGLAMTFHASEVGDVPGWFRERLGYPVAVPDLADQGYRLTGGRKCKLGDCDAAYLFYEKGGRKASLFIVASGDLDFPMGTGGNYTMSKEGCSVRIWRNADRVHALVI